MEKKLNATTLVAGVAIGIIAVLAYQKYKPKPATINDQLADMSLTLAKSIKDAADKDWTAKQLYNTLLKEEQATK